MKRKILIVTLISELVLCSLAIAIISTPTPTPPANQSAGISSDDVDQDDYFDGMDPNDCSRGIDESNQESCQE